MFCEQKPDTKSLDLSFKATHVVALLIISQINQKLRTTREPVYGGCDFKPQLLLNSPPCFLPHY